MDEITVIEDSFKQHTVICEKKRIIFPLLVSNAVKIIYGKQIF